jgi:hypothetical protein
MYKTTNNNEQQRTMIDRINNNHLASRNLLEMDHFDEMMYEVFKRRLSDMDKNKIRRREMTETEVLFFNWSQTILFLTDDKRRIYDSFTSQIGRVLWIESYLEGLDSIEELAEVMQGQPQPQQPVQLRQ